MNNIASVFFADGYNLADEMLKTPIALNDLYKAMASQYSAIDTLIDSFVDRCQQSNVSVDCKKGCEYCCHQPVFASIHEIFYLKRYIFEHFSQEQIDKIKSRADDKLSKCIGVSDAELLKFSHPCPLLENGACSVYEARPMACRIYMSSDVKSCITRFNLKDSDKEFPALFEFILVAGRNMNGGFVAKLTEEKLQNIEMRFEKLLSLVLSDTVSEEEWLKGNDLVID